jgi:hypothetical protein
LGLKFLDESQKELMAHFGVAFYYAQMIENTTFFICSFKHFTRIKADTPNAYEVYKEKMKGKTLGKLFNELGNEFPEVYKIIPKERFSKIKNIRDNLAHKYFRDGLEKFLLSPNKIEMIKEIDGFAYELMTFDDELEKINNGFMGEAAERINKFLGGI